jgi:glutamate 5-kinase
VNIKAKRLIILSNIDGFYKNFWTSEAQIIESINENNIEQYKQYITEDKSSFGRWGGGSKIGLFETVMKQGIWGVLANGKEPWIIQKVFFHDQPCKKTLFIPKQ